MRFLLATSVVALAVLATAAPRPAGQGKGVAVPITKRSNFTNADTTVNIEALKAHVESVKAKILRGLNNFESNTGVPHPAALTGNQKRNTGSVPLTDDANSMWYGAVSVGTPSSTFNVLYDTGSSDLFLPGPQCTVDCDGHAIYNPNLSSTSDSLGGTFKLDFGNGYSDVVVNTYADSVSVAGIVAENQTLGVATQYSSNLEKSTFPPDGLMGMGFQSIAHLKAPPVFQTLISEHKVDSSVFSFKLSSSGSELYLGGANKALYTGDFTYVPLTKAAWWEVNMDGIMANGQTLLSNIDCIIDTGTTLVMGKPADIAQFYTTLGGKAAPAAGDGYYTFPCDGFPSISFTFQGKSFPLSSNNLNLGPLTPGSSDCVSGIVGQDTGSSFSVIGDVFLQGVYSTFDVGNQRVGFAQLA